MQRRHRVLPFVVIGLLLPGLSLAAPVPGACGTCELGTPCPEMRTPEPAPEAVSCCSGDAEMPAADEPATGICDCGRDAPPAVAAPPSSVEAAASVDEVERDASDGLLLSAPVARIERPPAPPPTIFLRDCAFLI
jgi:hypothetical protein